MALTRQNTLRRNSAFDYRKPGRAASDPLRPNPISQKYTEYKRKSYPELASLVLTVFAPS